MLLIFRTNLLPVPLNYLSERNNMSLFSNNLKRQQKTGRLNPEVLDSNYL